MVGVAYYTKNVGVVKDYNKAKELGIVGIKYYPVEESYKADAVNALLKARRNARKAVK